MSRGLGDVYKRQHTHTHTRKYQDFLDLNEKASKLCAVLQLEEPLTIAPANGDALKEDEEQKSDATGRVGVKDCVHVHPAL